MRKITQILRENSVMLESKDLVQSLTGKGRIRPFIDG